MHSQTLKKVKMNVRLKMQYFTKGVKAQVKEEKHRGRKKKKDKKQDPAKAIKEDGKVKKEEPKAQKLPQTQQINNLVQHDKPKQIKQQNLV